MGRDREGDAAMGQVGTAVAWTAVGHVRLQRAEAGGLDLGISWFEVASVDSVLVSRANASGFAGMKHHI